MGESRMSDRPDENNNVTRENPKPPVWYRNCGVKTISIGVGLTMAVMLTTWLTVKATAPEIVTFDMKGTMDLFIQQTLAQKLPEAQSKVLMVRFNRAMSDSLQSWQGSNNAVILVAPAVVSQQPDITMAIRNDIALRMQSVTEVSQ